MVLELGPLRFANPQGLWALLALVPLLILYLIRPRPKPVKIPSLMFFMKTRGARKFSSFLKQITKDWLFLLQLLIVLVLALSFADPYTMYSHDITADNTVIVLDVSASSQTVQGGKTRFDVGIEKAKDSLGGKNTLILAKDVPFVAAQDISSSEMRKYLNSLQPKTTTSQIGEAIILAGEMLKGDGRIVVISDFINTGGQDPNIAKSMLETKGKIVEFINTAEEDQPNIGIIDMDVTSDETTMYIKNYDNKAYKVPVSIAGSVKTLEVPAKGIETYAFQTPSGVTKIELGVDDHLAADNLAYISAPDEGKARVLIVTNNRSTFLENALLASGEVNLEVAIPPVMP
ncbi:VWA domain-containing protein, partial [Candidatus Woesearchaeota archaeon]|nr:VWA domain-containing protein [Candidatus Woesearchaeota archaeon]